MKHFCFLVLILLLLQTVRVAAYRQTESDAVSPLVLKSGRLSVSANITGGNEDEIRKPLKAKFYLLRKSFVEILKSEDFHPVDEDDNDLTGDEDFLKATAYALTSDDEESVLLSVLIEESIRVSRISVIDTDSDGFGKSETLKSGSYYLFGYAKLENEMFVWNLPLKISGAQTHVLIDQHNAEAVIEIDAGDSDANEWRKN